VSEADSVFTGKIPALYDQHLGPALFWPYARDLAQRLQFLTAGHLLEIAAGTGIVTHALADALPETVAITATDLNQPMLDYAAAKPGAARVTWRQADAQALPFTDENFHVVVCQFGVMFFPDKPQAYREVRRVLKPGGRFLFNVWSAIDRNPITQVVHESVAALFPTHPPGFLARTPHGYHDVSVISAALEDAGFVGIEAERRVEQCRSPAGRDIALAFCEGSPLNAEIVARDPGRVGEATEAATLALVERFGGGAIAAPMEAIIFTCARPK
jgi:SAM-dependent methyltransferase